MLPICFTQLEKRAGTIAHWHISIKISNYKTVPIENIVGTRKTEFSRCKMSSRYKLPILENSAFYNLLAKIGTYLGISMIVHRECKKRLTKKFFLFNLLLHSYVPVLRSIDNPCGCRFESQQQPQLF